MTPNLENIKLLVEALRSNKYPQGKGWLNKQGCLCVWGVACEVYMQNGGELLKLLKRETKDYVLRQSIVDVVSYSGKTAIPPPEVQYWLGISIHTEMNSGYSSGNDTLAGLNDNGVQLFLLADILERRFLKGNVPCPTPKRSQFL